MTNASIPEGFVAWWDGTTLFVRLPPVVETDAHTLTPVLSSADARALAAVAAAGEEGPAHRVVLTAQPGYDAASIERFRERLVNFLEERGARTNVDWTFDAPADLEAPVELEAPVDVDSEVPMVPEAPADPEAPVELEPLAPDASQPEAPDPLDLLLPSPPPAPPSEDFPSPDPAPTPPSPEPTRPPAPIPTRRRHRGRDDGTEPRAHLA